MSSTIRTSAFSAIGILTAFALLGWTGTPGQSVESATPIVEECEATFDPDTIERGSEEEVDVTFSESIGAVESVEAEADSGLMVEWMHDEDDHEPEEGRLHVDATEGQSGTWTITFEGENAECEGDLTVNYNG